MILVALVLSASCIADNDLAALEPAVQPEPVVVQAATPGTGRYDRRSCCARSKKLPKNPVSHGRGSKGSGRGGKVRQQPRKHN